MTKDKVVTDYLKGYITIRETRLLLNKIEGRRLVKLIDKK